LGSQLSPNPNATYADKIRPTGESFVASGVVKATTKTPDIHAIRNSNYVSRGVGKISQMENVTMRQEAQQFMISKRDNNKDSTEWKLVERKKQKPQNKLPTVMGTASPTLAGDFAGRKRMAWLFITRVRKGTTSTHVENYLKLKAENCEIDVKDLNSKSDYHESFRVGTELSRVENFMDSSFWPDGVIVRGYRFFFSERSS
ncbi:hypothetical protein HHI36_004716, partial [Cryptolaemus montrouzieri]